MFVWSRFPQVFPDAPDQQTGHGVHRPGNVRVEHVPATVLGLFPRGRLFPQTVRRGTGRWRRRLITSHCINYYILYPCCVVFFFFYCCVSRLPIAIPRKYYHIVLCFYYTYARPFASHLLSSVTFVRVSTSQ